MPDHVRVAYRLSHMIAHAALYPTLLSSGTANFYIRWGKWLRKSQ